MHLTGRREQGVEFPRLQHRWLVDEQCPSVFTGQQGAFGGAVGVAQRNPHQESVELAFRECKGADLVARVLGCNYEEGLGQWPGAAFCADLALFHGFEEGTLGLGGGAVDLVGKHQLGEHWPRMKAESAVALIEDGYADDICRQHVAGELDALELQTQKAGQNMGEGGLADPGNVFDQQMATGKHACKGKAHRMFLAEDDAAGCFNEAVGNVNRHGVGFFQRQVKWIMALQEHSRSGLSPGNATIHGLERLARGRGEFMTSTAFITHRDCWLHNMGEHHPESPERLGAINDRLIAAGLDMYLSFHDAPVATVEQLSRAHPQDHVEELLASVPEHGIRHLDPDTALCPHSMKAALRSAGAGIYATDLVMSGEAENAFCAIRPPGHHAEAGKAMGFCFFNNVAVAARHALEAHGLKRVAIIDFDVHHGNGTEDIFKDDPRVLMVSIFQHPFYPYSGADNPAPNMVNVPIKAGSRGDVFREIVTDIWMPALRNHAPEMLFISAGFDAHYEDDMGSLGLVEADYMWVTEQLKTVAAECANRRIVSLLEGGYSLSSLARSVVSHIKTLADL
jgi:acetoin utilization deacetylase AcuC-like enzyme